MATPILIAQMVPAFAPAAPAATAMVATSVIVTSVAVPIITALWAKQVKKGKLAHEVIIAKQPAP